MHCVATLVLLCNDRTNHSAGMGLLWKGYKEEPFLRILHNREKGGGMYQLVSLLAPFAIGHSLPHRELK